mgnify:CR=1 FL=1
MGACASITLSCRNRQTKESPMEKDGYEHVTLKMTIREYLELPYSLREPDYLSVPWQYFINVRGAITMQDALMEHYFLRVAEDGPYTPVYWNGRWSERHYAYFCMFNTRNNQGDWLTGLQRRCVKGLEKQLDMLGCGCSNREPTYAIARPHSLSVFKERLPHGPERLYVYAVCYYNWVKKTKEIRQLPSFFDFLYILW